VTGKRETSPLFVCHGCGAVVDAARAFPFACPNARADDDIDHVLVAPTDVPDLGAGDEDDPFLRYRRWLAPYRLARAARLSDAAWADLVGALDEALKAVDGRGFRRTPFARQPGLAGALGRHGDLWIKDETHNVSGSHKARHLMGVMLYLRVLEISRLALGQDLRARRLAIASCGGAAVAAASSRGPRTGRSTCSSRPIPSRASCGGSKTSGRPLSSARGRQACAATPASSPRAARSRPGRSRSACKVRTTASPSKARAPSPSKWPRRWPPKAPSSTLSTFRSAAGRWRARLRKGSPWPPPPDFNAARRA
jgi:hypothetical protein